VAAEVLPALLRPASRQALPRDASGLPPLGRSFRERLDRALQELDLDLTPGMRAAMEDHVRLLLAWNTQVNLTGIRDEEAIAREHIADSLAAVPLILARERLRHPLRLLDLGSGAGYPGLPLAVALPVGTAVLLDSVAKKVAFLEVAAAASADAIRAAGEEPPALRAVRARAEELGHDPAYRARWDVVTARAVAAFPALVELVLPLLRRGGVLLAWKRDPGDGSLQSEVTSAAPFLRPLGASPDVQVAAVPVAGLEDHRIVVLTKRRSTPGRFPRPAARLGHPLLL
jgi:16S rRNA (guanine527-N7)-methyltransferase